MGVYNPDAPRLLGQQWVPIRNEDVPYSPTVNSIEHGYQYTLTSSRRIRDARFYLNKFPESQTSLSAVMFNTYVAGQEALSGPIQQVVVPCSNATITGSGGTNFTIVGGNLANALYRPDDGTYVFFTYAANVLTFFSTYFDVSKFPQLAGKRILNVSLEYAGVASDSAGNSTAPIPLVNPGPQQITTEVDLLTPIGGSGLTYAVGAFSNLGSLAQLSPPPPAPIGSNTAGASIGTLNLGDANPFWNGSTFPDGTLAPWTYDQLLRFRGTGVNPFELRTLIQVPFTAYANGTGGFITITYYALRITYCEETRVMAGGNTFNYQSFTNIAPQRDLAGTADPVLAAGNYVTTLSYINPGDRSLFQLAAGAAPAVNGLREKYSLPGQVGVDVTIPFPLDSSIGSQFSRTTTHILPQISLHTSGGVLTEIHPYGRQSVGQVFGVQTVTQEVLDGAAGGSFQFPQVRFFARRFGNTTVPLTLSSPTITGAGTTVSITPAAFDALTEIIDGWKQVDLRFSGTVTMGAGTNPQWVWSASGELPGNRWEILGAAAPAISGVVGTPFNLAAQQLGAATYGQPSSGTTINEGWLPQGGPYVSGSTDDQTSDAVLIFSQDMPTVTGFSVSAASQPLSGVALDCSTYPWYVPSAMAYNQITWSDTSFNVPVSGFGYYELQRSDALTDWQTIAQLSGPASLNLSAVNDDFNRTVSSGFGTPDSAFPGYIWSTTFGGTAANYNVAGGVATIALPDAPNSRNAVIGSTSLSDMETYTTVTLPATALTDNYNSYLLVRRLDGSNTYMLRAAADTSGNVDVSIQRILGGSTTSLVTASNVFAYAPGDVIAMRFRVTGSLLQGKVWNVTTSEPSAWTVTTTDTTIATGAAGIRADRNTTNSNAGLVLTYGSFVLTVPGFNDYEARVGVLTSYRIRAVNSYLFAGPWSSTATITMASPGLTGQGMTSRAYTLIFTSNFAQTGQYNLAYALAYEGDTTEQFQFPESGFTQYQLMYGRDFQVAFRPTERGGEVFSRNVLIQAAAIPPETLADFVSLRDMAWASLPYVCVRDGDGNRWFANVTVPEGRVLDRRRVYMGSINVVEVTATSATTVV